MDSTEFLLKAGQSRGGGIRSDIKLKFGQIPRVGGSWQDSCSTWILQGQRGKPKAGP